MAEIQLRIAEAAQPDVGKGIARIDGTDRKKIECKPGDIIEVEGKRKTGAIIVEAYQNDAGLGIIRVDGLTRRNAGTGIGENVTVRKIDAGDAKKVVFAPAEKGMRIMVSPQILQRNMIGKVVAKGDVVTPLPPRRRKETFQEVPSIFGFLGDIEEMFNAPMGLTGEIKFVVTNTAPTGIVRITNDTQVEILPEAREIETGAIPDVTYEDVGGLREEIQKVREMIELPLKHPELFRKLGIDPPKGVLLYGPPGTGKTLIAKAVANESDAYFISVAGPEIMSKFYGESEERLREVFKEAEENSPAIIFIDEVDAIAPKREEVTGEVERRVVAQLLSLMDGLKGRGEVIVIAATNRPNAVDPALRLPGRFDREIEIGIPDKNGRKEILQIHTRGMPFTDDVDLEKLASITHGFVGADLAALSREAAMHTLRKVLPELNLESDVIPPEVLDKLKITQEDFEAAKRNIEPSALREVLVEVPNVNWADVGGLDEVKQELIESVEWPIKHPEAFERMGVKPPKGILLYGPPGSGKTLLAKAVANESEANFIAIKGPEILSKWVGESEKAIRETFRKGRQASPSIIFFDEIDAIAPSRGSGLGDARVTERVISQLLTELDGLEPLENVVVLAATNRPDIIDSALLRAGRFDRTLYVPGPDEKARLEIFKVHTKGMPLTKDVNLEEIAKKSEGYAGSDIEALCREAAILAIREDIKAKKVNLKHFEKAMEKIRPSITPELIATYGRISKMFGKPRISEETLEYAR